MVCISRNEEKVKRQRVREILDLQPKIEEAEMIIRMGLTKCHKPVVAFSGGKDSLVVLDIARRIKPDIKAVFENTTNEYPETIQYVKSIPNVLELKPDISFEECFKKYGLPVMKSKAKSHGNQCCIKLKEEPFLKAKEEYGWDGTITGLTADESRNRMMMLKRMINKNRDTVLEGMPIYFHKSEQIWKIHPIHNWSDQEVWSYIDFRKIPYNSIYDILGRNARCGCRLCTAYISWKKRTSQYNEKDTHILARKQGYMLIMDFDA